MLLMFESFVPFSSRLWLFSILIWQWILTFAWSGVVGGFGGRYFDGSRSKMAIAAGLNIVNMIIWLNGSLLGSIGMYFSRKRPKHQDPDEETSGYGRHY